MVKGRKFSFRSEEKVVKTRKQGTKEKERESPVARKNENRFRIREVRIPNCQQDAGTENCQREAEEEREARKQQGRKRKRDDTKNERTAKKEEKLSEEHWNTTQEGRESFTSPRRCFFLALLAEGGCEAARAGGVGEF